MKEIEPSASQFPRHELAIRRLYARDATFREICEDYDQALCALRYRRSAASSSGPRVEQYRELVNELEGEISKILEGSEESASGWKTAEAEPWSHAVCRVSHTGEGWRR